MASSPNSSVSDSTTSNPFADASPNPIVVAAVQHVNIYAHVPVILDFTENNYNMWCAFFDITFSKFGISDHVDGSIDPQTKFHDVKWLQVDQDIVSWLYTSVTPRIMKMVFLHQPMVIALWPAIKGLFLENADQRAVYTLQECHGLFQGDFSITDYFGCLKQLSDLLYDVGHPVPEPSLVINALGGLNSKFSHAISTITAFKPLPSFLFIRNYLLQDEHR
jgi:hypothetical protein